MSHVCPAARCPRTVPDHLLMCVIHWKLVPRPLAKAVYRAYQGGAGLGSQELFNAQYDAIRAVNTKLGYPEEEL